MENTKEKPIKVLFVCLGNICRSPSGEAVMNKYIANAGLNDKIICDSAGTLAYHAGEPADARMQTHANKRNYRLTSISRKIKDSDFDEFDYIIGMDENNMHDIKTYPASSLVDSKISQMINYCSNDNPGYVPDPYYGGSAGFEQVLDILEDACEGLLKHIKAEHNF